MENITKEELVEALKKIESIADEMQNNAGHLVASDFKLFGAGSQRIMNVVYPLIKKVEGGV